MPIPPKTRHAAHFLLLPELLYSPPNEAIIHALLSCGHMVHVFAPGAMPDRTDYGTRVITHRVDYSERWLIRNALSPFWRSIHCFSATSEDPLATSGMLAFLHGRPSFMLVDEIKAGSYRGDRSERWKKLCRWAMRRARFTIVNDNSRVELLRNYAGLPDAARVIVYPGCFRSPPPADSDLRRELRSGWGLDQDALVIASSGCFSLSLGADWLIRSLQERTEMQAVIQPIGVSPLSLFLLRNLGLGSRVYLEERRLGWQEAWRSAVGFDIGLAIYTNQAPQFQRMGISSNRLCMFIAMGVPVICSRQDSFRFVEDYDCGRMVESYEEFLEAVDEIGRNLPAMRRNCLRCYEEYIMPPDRYSSLERAIHGVLGDAAGHRLGAGAA